MLVHLARLLPLRGCAMRVCAEVCAYCSCNCLMAHKHCCIMNITLAKKCNAHHPFLRFICCCDHDSLDLKAFPGAHLPQPLGLRCAFRAQHDDRAAASRKLCGACINWAHQFGWHSRTMCGATEVRYSRLSLIMSTVQAFGSHGQVTRLPRTPPAPPCRGSERPGPHRQTSAAAARSFRS